MQAALQRRVLGRTAHNDAAAHYGHEKYRIIFCFSVFKIQVVSESNVLGKLSPACPEMGNDSQGCALALT